MMARHLLVFALVGIVVLSGCSKAAQAPPPNAPTTAAPSSQPAPTAQAPTPTAQTSTRAVSFTDISGIAAEQAIKDMAGLGIFDSATGEFKPRDLLTRAEFVRWLVKANNVYYKDQAAQQIRPAESNDTTFVDVPPTHPDFKYIQGMANAGFVIGVDKNHFAPDRPITREEMLAIKVSRVAEAVGYTSQIKPLDPASLPFSDGAKVNPIYAAYVEIATRTDIGRVWGGIKTLNPQKPVTRSEAALCLSVFRWNSDLVSAAKAIGRTP